MQIPSLFCLDSIGIPATSIRRTWATSVAARKSRTRRHPAGNRSGAVVSPGFWGDLSHHKAWWPACWVDELWKIIWNIHETSLNWSTNWRTIVHSHADWVCKIGTKITIQSIDSIWGTLKESKRHMGLSEKRVPLNLMLNLAGALLWE